jgi:Uma2 family endonuclease
MSDCIRAAIPRFEDMAMVTTRQYTAEDLYRIASDDDDYELIEGDLVPMVPPNLGHADVQLALGTLLRAHASRHGLGRVVGEAGFILQRNPDTVLAPDVAFITEEKWPDDTTGFAQLAPDLAIEIVSAGKSPGEIERKLAIYLQSGVRAVWIVYPLERQIVVHTASHPPTVFKEADHIDGGDVLPGLVLPVSHIFP